MKKSVNLNDVIYLSDVPAGAIFSYENKHYIKTKNEDNPCRYEYRSLALSVDDWKIYYFRIKTLVKIVTLSIKGE